MRILYLLCALVTATGAACSAALAFRATDAAGFALAAAAFSLNLLGTFGFWAEYRRNP